jgi:hypothetical protein
MERKEKMEKAKKMEPQEEGLTPYKEAEKKEEILPVRKLNVASTPNTVLVEWVSNQEVHRGFIPAKQFSVDGVPASVLGSATPYGLPWSELIVFSGSAKDLEKALHNAGIWTFEDLVQFPQAAVGALQTAYHNDLAALRSAAKNYNKEASK